MQTSVDTPVLLLVEDNRADVYLVKRAIEHHHVPVQVVVASDGDEAVKYLEKAAADPKAACPEVMLVDLNLPKKSGIEVLERVRELPRYDDVPVIIVTTSGARSDREHTALLGASRYFQKPLSYQEFLRIGELLKEVLDEAGNKGPGAIRQADRHIS